MCKNQYTKKLVVLGNGFNLWLGLPTKYSDYKDFLKAHSNEYGECLKLMDIITKSCNDKQWSHLEDDMFKFVLSNKVYKEEWNVDIKKACDQKNKSLFNWIKSIRDKYKNELIELHKLFNDILSKNETHIWTFNFVISWLNGDKDFKIQLVNTYGQPPKRGVTQLHYRENANGTEADILFGGDWSEIKKFVRSDDDNDNNNFFYRFSSKFFDKNLNNKIEEKFKSATSFGGDFPSDPTSQHLNDGDGLAWQNWANLPENIDGVFNRIYFVGFSLGNQDIKYFITNNERNPIKWIIKNNGKIITSFHDTTSLLQVIEAWFQNSKYINDVFNYLCFQYVDLVIEEIFSDKFNLLLDLKKKIKNKKL